MNDSVDFGCFLLAVFICFISVVVALAIGLDLGEKRGRAHGLEIRGMEIDCGVDFQIKHENEWFVYHKRC